MTSRHRSRTAVCATRRTGFCKPGCLCSSLSKASSRTPDFLTRPSRMDGFTVLRTFDIEETKWALQQLVRRMENECGTATGTCTSKRKKFSEAETIWIRMVSCIPTFSESISRAILNHFGTMQSLQRALREPKSFPDISITASTKLGRARVQTLVEVLCPPE